MSVISWTWNWQPVFRLDNILIIITRIARPTSLTNGTLLSTLRLFLDQNELICFQHERYARFLFFGSLKNPTIIESGSIKEKTEIYNSTKEFLASAGGSVTWKSLNFSDNPLLKSQKVHQTLLLLWSFSAKCFRSCDSYFVGNSNMNHPMLYT